jgi:DNA-binding response OmpR family regulator
LLVEDSERRRTALTRGLHGTGFTADVAGDGVAANGLLGAYAYDLRVRDKPCPFPS